MSPELINGLQRLSTAWAFASGIYGGAQNTKKSIARAAASGSTCPAASVCDNLTSGGYTDWYLPSKDELDMMYVNLHMQGLGGFASSGYWSSTEGGSNYDAWIQDFGTGNQHISNAAKGNSTLCSGCSGFLTIYQFIHLTIFYNG